MVAPEDLLSLKRLSAEAGQVIKKGLMHFGMQKGFVRRLRLGLLSGTAGDRQQQCAGNEKNACDHGIAFIPYGRVFRPMQR
jgi:hypothetical protein